MLNLSFRAVLALAAFSFLLLSCDTSDPFSIPPPDFSTVPEPYNINNIESITITEGVKLYIHEKSTSPYYVTSRDIFIAYLTVRTSDGEIIHSSFANNSTNPIQYDMTVADGRSQDIHFNVAPNSRILAYTPGFKKAMIDRNEGERLTIVVDSEVAYKNIPQNNVNSDFREDILIYDILISQIPDNF